MDGILHAVPNWIRLNSLDNVVVARARIEQDANVDVAGVRPLQAIPRGHKMSVADIAAGAPVRKYGQIIGFATADIRAGEHVHSHNLAVGEFTRDHAFCVDARPTDYVDAAARAHFEGYVRPDGRVGTRNYIAVIASVNCSATVSRAVAAHFASPDIMARYPGVDGVIALTHGGGLRDQHEYRRV